MLLSKEEYELTIYEAREILRKRFPNVNPTSGFEYKNLFIFDPGKASISLPYAVNKDTKIVFVFNPMKENQNVLNQAYLKTKTIFGGDKNVEV